MGEVCSCFVDPEEKFSSEHVSILATGGKFLRSIYLGLSSQELWMRLSDDKSSMSWRTVNSSTEEYGEIDLVETVQKVRPTGQQGLQYVSADNKVVFEVQAEDTAKRDQWIVAMNELFAKWEDVPESKPKKNLSAAKTSNKVEYFKAREADIAQREKEAAEKKKKYAAGGMKYTALAMANRT